MPDEITPEARLAVASAFAYAGPMGSNEFAWKARFQEGLMRAGAAMNGFPAQEAQAMIDAQVFAGEYGGYDYEESSTRLLVKIKSDTGRDKGKDADGYERIRTDRTDGSFGKTMKHRLDQVPIGSRIVTWKVLEKMKNDDQKVRVLKHFEVIQYNKDSASSGQRPPAAPSGEGDGAVRPLAPSPTEAPSSVAHSPEWSPVLERIRALEPGPLGEFVRQCAAEKLWWKNPKNSDDEGRIVRILAEKEKL